MVYLVHFISLKKLMEVWAIRNIGCQMEESVAPKGKGQAETLHVEMFAKLFTNH